MNGKEKFWKTAEIVIGGIGGAMLIMTLVLKLLGKNITVLTYSIVGIVILFLICDEIARSYRRRREREEIAKKRAEHPEETVAEPILPKDAFEFENSDRDAKK